MNKTALTTIAPDIYRKRLIVEGYFLREITEATLLAYFAQLTRELGLRTYADPIIHRTAGQGKAARERAAGNGREQRAGTRLPPCRTACTRSCTH